jgi:hypothetical protein
MLRLLRPAVPASWTVLVLADCGVDARLRFRRMARLGWHPFLRINQGGTFRLAGQARCVWWSTLVGAAGRHWRGRGTAFASSDCRLDGTLAAWWSDGHAKPWLVLTDRDPDGVRCAVGRPAQLVRPARQRRQTWRVAVAADPDDESGAGQSPVVGVGRCDAGDGDDRQRSGGRVARRYARPARDPGRPLRSPPPCYPVVSFGVAVAAGATDPGTPIADPPSPGARTLARSSIIRHTTDTAFQNGG